MIWTVFMPVLNEAQIIESKILNALSFAKHVVIVEGSISPTYDVAANGLSSDGTTEILKQYSDKIVYLPKGKVVDTEYNQPRAKLQNYALEYIHKHFPDTQILHRTDADEFINASGIKTIERYFECNNYWMIYTDLVNLVDGSRYRPNKAPQGQVFNFNPQFQLKAGMYHERFYRYRPDLMYRGTAHALSDCFGRALFYHPDYFFNRDLLNGLRILHYKYVDGLKRLLKAEMSYLVEDEHMIPNCEPTFQKAKERLKSVLDGQLWDISISEHAEEVLRSKWFKPEIIHYDWNITLDEVLS